jgi:hypothetical protein
MYHVDTVVRGSFSVPFLKRESIRTFWNYPEVQTGLLVLLHVVGGPEGPAAETVGRHPDRSTTWVYTDKRCMTLSTCLLER